MRRPLQLVCAGAMVLATAPVNSLVLAQPSLSERMTETLAARIEQSDVPGVNAAIVFDDGTHAQAAAGLARIAPNEAPMTTDSRMLSGSIGKLYCSVVALGLADEGRIDLDAPVSDYLGDEPWFAELPNSADLTVRSVMNHTSGIPEHVWSPAFGAALRDDPWAARTFAELLEFSRGVDALFPVREGWSYADTNYLVVGAVIEAVTGRAYEDELRERVLGPLGLDDTLTNDGPELEGLVSGYTGLSRMFPIGEETAADGKYGMNPQFERTGGGITSTALDLARFGHTVFVGDAVPERFREELLDAIPSPQLGPGSRYGLGVILQDSPHGPRRGHTGIMPGYLSAVWHYPDLGATVAVQINSDRGGAGRELERLVETVADLAAEASGP